MGTTVTYSIRPATHEDSNVLSSLAIQVWTHNYCEEGIDKLSGDFLMKTFLPEQFENRIENNNIALFVVSNGKNLIGFVEICINNPCPLKSGIDCEINKFYIQEPFCNKGLGKQMLAYVVDWAKKSEVNAIWLQTWEHNNRSIQFYKRSSFEYKGDVFFEGLAGEKHKNYIFHLRL
jgi:diamine N-acetyltransferase